MPKTYPHILVLCDVNTTQGGTLYEASRSFVDGLTAFGAFVSLQPYAVPGKMTDQDAWLAAGMRLSQHYDGYVSLGGIFETPASFYTDGAMPPPPSGAQWTHEKKRFPLDAALTQAFVYRNRPVLSICGGAHVLAGLYGCKLGAIEGHYLPGETHAIQIAAKTQLRKALKTADTEICSTHHEGIRDVSPRFRVAARASVDGAIEAIELKDCRFVLGILGHPERHLQNARSPWHALLQAFVKVAAHT